MATMLAYIFTDAAVARDCLRAILKRSADQTFHCVTVDGDMSRNDTVLFLANGACGNSPVRRGSREEKALSKASEAVMKDLALKLVEDGEGGTKVVEVLVEGARSVAQAKRVAFTVANSKLVPHFSAPTRISAASWPPSDMRAFRSGPGESTLPSMGLRW